MNEGIYQLGSDTNTNRCKDCGDLLDDISKFGYCYECFLEIQEEIIMEDDDYEPYDVDFYH